MPEPTAADLLARFVGFDTVSRNSNRALADAIANLLDRPGVSITHALSPDGDKTNLIVVIGPQPDPDTREGLVLSGHMDVVPADEPEWESDPFVLTDRGTCWVGRGAADMKGFLAVAVHRARRIDPATLRHPLVFVLTYDEELGTLGAHDLVTHWQPIRTLPRAALIGEPTGLRPVRMHKGHLKLRIRTAGRSAHSGYPHLGRNAIEPVGRAITELTSLRETLERERGSTSEFFGQVPYVALNIAQVEGGTAINVVPDQCTLDVGMRILPGMSSEAFVARVDESLRRAIGIGDYTLEILGDSPPMMIPGTADTLRRVTRASGREPIESVSFATDAGWLQTVGMECVICGPGSIEVAHRPNESVPKADLLATDAMLDRLLDDYLT